VSLVSANNKPNIRVDNLHVHVGGVGIHVSCGFLTPIIQLVIEILKGHIINQVVHALEGQVPGLIMKEVNKLLNDLPLDIDIGPNLQIRYLFNAAPNIKNDYMFTGIYAFIHPKGNPTPPPYNIPDVPEFDPANPKGVQFFLTDYVIKSALDTAFKLGLLYVELEQDVLEHHLKMTCKAPKVPEFQFVDAIDVVVSAECTVVFDRNDNNRFTIFADLHLNLKEYIKQAVIFFSISEAKFLKLEYKTDKPIDIEWFKKGVNQVLEIVIQIVNGYLGVRGIPLPKFNGVDYSDMVQFVKKGYLEVGTTPIFHF
jgi:hypothetical protein